MREPRAAVMTIVEASWRDEAGTMLTVPACMEVKSANGACIRVKTPIGVGSKLSIQWRFERFTGIARNCRGEGREYLVGIQRDTGHTPTPSPAIPTPADVSPLDRLRGTDAPPSLAASAAAWTAKMRRLRKPQVSLSQESKLQEGTPQESKLAENQLSENKLSENKPSHGPVAGTSGNHPRELRPTQQTPENRMSEVPPTPRKVTTVPFLRIPGATTPLLPRRVAHESGIRDGPHISQPRFIGPASRTGVPAKQPPGGKDPGNERKRMRPKWLGLAPWQNKQDALSESRNGTRTSNDESEKEKPMSHLAPLMKKAATGSAGEDSATFQVDLLPMDDIYRTAGIMSPPKGYGIKKVVDMLNSEYVRALSKDMKRAAVLMALDAAGVPISQLQQDAKSRQDALDSYEAAQRKQVEAEWARKAEENVQIQAEMERVKAHHMARIARNLDAIAREKATFSDWLAIKQQETHSMLEAAELCLKASISGPVAGPPPGKTDADAKAANEPVKGLLSAANLAKAASAGSKPM